MRSRTVSLVVVLVTACLASGSSPALNRVQNAANSKSVLRGPADVAERMQSRYEEAVKLTGGGVESASGESKGNAKKLTVEFKLGDDGKVSEKPPVLDRCHVTSLIHLGRCGCHLAKKMKRLKPELAESCRVSLGQEDDLMQRSCRLFVDEWGRFKVPILIRKSQETLKSCSSPSSVLEATRQAENHQNSLTALRRKLEDSDQIKNLLSVLQALNSILKGLKPTQTPAMRRLVARNVQKGFNPKTARLMAYNNISVVPAAETS